METPQSATASYAKGWLLFVVIEFLVGTAFGLAFGWLTLHAFMPRHWSFVDIGLAKLAAGILIGLPISFFAFRWSVARFVVRPLLRDSTRQAP